jgi:UMF1 family MFS transporter
MNQKSSIKIRFAWYFFDIGNSAHALLVSTVGFSLYFKQYLLQGSEKANSSWGILTAIILGISALFSPLISSLARHFSRTGLFLSMATIFSVMATALLATDLSQTIIPATIIYVISSVGYYLALPLYNSLLPDISNGDEEKISANGWGLGYIGGIIAVGVCFVLGYLGADVLTQTETFRKMFLVAAVLNLFFSIAIMVYALKNDQYSSRITENNFSLSKALLLFKRKPELHVLRLFISYWLVSEAGTVVIYFTALLLAEVGGMSAKKVLLLTLFVQVIASISTKIVALLAEKYSPKLVFYYVSCGWMIAPLLLYLYSIRRGNSYWIALVVVSLVLGAHHSIVRAEVSRVAKRLREDKTVQLSSSDEGALFGFLEVAGRIAQILGPLVVGIASIFLNIGLSVAIVAVFPLFSIIIIKKYKWIAS